MAGEPLGTFDDDQLKHAAVEADRLSGRIDQGAWRPAVMDADPCPDETVPRTADRP